MIDVVNDDDVLQLLGRPIRARLTLADRRWILGARVLVTGAGGSIGSALAKSVAACGPSSLALLDRSEYDLVRIERDIRAQWPAVDVVPALADVTRHAYVGRICERVRPTVIYHAAAYKHVTVAERAIVAVAEANVLGTAVAVDAAARWGARFVLISSDKAASPEGVMGATKRLAELVTLSRRTETFRPVVVRFGNVLGSSGSFLEILCDALRANRPVPITDPRATRYFMTASEAVALVIRADRLAPAQNEISWLDMGVPVRIGDLAERLIALVRAASGRDAKIEIIGLRPGEKLHEQLVDGALEFRRSPDRRVLRAVHPSVDRMRMDRLVLELAAAARAADDRAALDAVAGALPGFVPSEAARQWAGQAVPVATPSRRSVA